MGNGGGRGGNGNFDRGNDNFNQSFPPLGGGGGSGMNR